MKAEEFCRESTSIHYESGYLYLNSLLANLKLSSALKVDYMLFFANPFDHNQLLTSNIEELTGLLTQYESDSSLQAKMDNFDKAIFYFYLNQT